MQQRSTTRFLFTHRFLFTSFLLLLTTGTHAAQEKLEHRVLTMDKATDRMRKLFDLSKTSTQEELERALLSLGIRDVPWPEQFLPFKTHMYLLAQAQEDVDHFYNTVSLMNRNPGHATPPLIQEKIDSLKVALSVMSDRSFPLDVRQTIRTQIDQPYHFRLLTMPFISLHVGQGRIETLTYQYLFDKVVKDLKEEVLAGLEGKGTLETDDHEEDNGDNEREELLDGDSNEEQIIKERPNSIVGWL